MADNVSLTSPAGTAAADEVTDGTLGTVKVQYVKIMDGTLDGTTKAAVGSNGLKVDGSGATQPVSGTVTVTQGTASATPWTAKLTDGTNAVTIKAGSSGAAAASDVAAVVTIRDQNANGQAASANSTPVVQSGFKYQAIAASQTDTAFTGGGGGATGDRLWTIWVVPATTSPGAVSVKDGAGSSITLFTGGASSVTTLIPFPISLNARSGSGAWKITTGANVSVVVTGDPT